MKITKYEKLRENSKYLFNKIDGELLMLDKLDKLRVLEALLEKYK